MERSERTFVPEWLRSAGNVAGAGSSAHHSALSSSQSDAVSLGNPLRIKSSKCSGDHDSPRSDFLEPTSRRNLSGNGFARRPYSSFRSHRDKERDQEKHNFPVDHWNTGSFHPVAKILGRDRKDVFARSRSIQSGKQNDELPIISSGSHINKNGVILDGTVVTGTQSSFRKNFPCLGADEKLGLDLGRASSPGLSKAIQNLPSSNSSAIGGEGWSSVLAEVPSVNGTNGTGLVSVQIAGSSSVSGPPNSVSGLNMAEALAQAPSRAQSAPQLHVQTQRLEELALKQSRQLIPMTPSISKVSGFNSGDKGKLKTLSKSGEIVVAGKSGQLLQQQQQQQQLSSLNAGSQSSRFKSDPSNGTQVGKYHVLKPVWDNDIGTKDASSSISATNESVNTVAAPPMAVASERRNSKKAQNVGEPRKMCSAAQAQSRNDFFNLMRNKNNSMNQNQNHRPTPLTPSASGEETKAATAAGRSSIVDNAPNGEGEVHSNGGVEGELSPSSAATHLEEEEARFLRSLGWEEDCGEDEGLTEEEINSFFEVYVKSKPSPRG